MILRSLSPLICDKPISTMSDVHMEVGKLFESRFRSLICDTSEIITHYKAVQKDFKCDEQCKDTNIHRLSCSTCNSTFADDQEHRAHYKMEWHLFNLKRRLKSLPSITQGDFNASTDIEKKLMMLELESTTPAQNSTDDALPLVPGQIFLTTTDKRILLVYRCLLAQKREEITDLHSKLHALFDSPRIAVILLGGGHFAGAIFEGSTMLKHQTHHCYAVRSGQGTLQTAHDNKGHMTRSAGSQLRRLNLQQFTERVRGTLHAWDADLRSCSSVLCSAPGCNNKSILYGGNASANSLRSYVRAIPITSLKPTLHEVQRVYDVLTNICVFDAIENVEQQLELHAIINKSKKTAQKSKKKEKMSSESEINKVKSQIAPIIAHENSSSSELDDDEECDSEWESCQYEIEEMSISLTEALQPFEQSPKKSVKKRGNNKANAVQEQLRRKQFLQCIQCNDLERFREFLIDFPSLRNAQLDDERNTALHICALRMKMDLLEELLSSGADLCAKNAMNQTPYSITKEATVRERFKAFATSHPDLFNYGKAHIPIVNELTPKELEEKQAEKAKARKAKRQKLKEKKMVHAIEVEEAEERRRFLALPDNEKRALAAERRMLQSGIKVLTRCFLCAQDITGKAGFSYSGNKFCTTSCLIKHRKE